MNRKIINKMTIINKTFITGTDDVSVVKSLLSRGWIKKRAFVFKKVRNSYDIEVDGSMHPLWNIKIFPKSENFDINDWKLRKDLRELRNLDKSLKRNLYIDDKNKDEVSGLLQKMNSSGFNLIYNNNFLILRQNNAFQIFKISSTMKLMRQKDGWYIGQKKVIE